MAYRILVVEDEVIIADEINCILKKSGYEVFEPAISYNEAMAAFSTIDPHIVILDVELSGKKTGIDVAEEIRKSSQIPLLFLSACADPVSQKQMRKFKPRACIDKAFFKNDLLQQLTKTIQDYTPDTLELNDFLTRRELEVLKLVKEGCTTREIADGLDISESTTKNHRHSICRGAVKSDPVS